MVKRKQAKPSSISDFATYCQGPIESINMGERNVFSLLISTIQKYDGRYNLWNCVSKGMPTRAIQLIATVQSGINFICNCRTYNWYNASKKSRLRSNMTANSWSNKMLLFWFAELMRGQHQLRNSCQWVFIDTEYIRKCALFSNCSLLTTIMFSMQCHTTSISWSFA